MLISLIDLAASVSVKKIRAAMDHQLTQKVPSILVDIRKPLFGVHVLWLKIEQRRITSENLHWLVQFHSHIRQTRLA